MPYNFHTRILSIFNDEAVILLKKEDTVFTHTVL